jgi:hypothetical protein
VDLLRFVLLIGTVFLSAVAVFMGAVVTAAALKLQAIHYSFDAGSQAVKRVITLAEDPAGFWQALALLGVLPMVLGIAGIWWGRRTLRAHYRTG